VKYELTYI